MKSNFYKPTGFGSTIHVLSRSLLKKFARSFSFLSLFLLAYFSGLTQTSSFSFSQISTDFARPGAGAEQWSGQWTVSGIPGPMDIYYRFSYADISSYSGGAGTYDFSLFDSKINDAISKGQKFSFCIMQFCATCGQGGNVNGAHLYYPQYLHNQMQNESPSDWSNNGQWIPNYNSPSWLSAWKALNTAVNNHIMSGSYNGVQYKNVIGYIDVSGYGDYGEWTNNQFSGPSGTIATEATLKTIIDGTVQSYQTFQCVALEATFDAGQLSNTNIPPAVGYYALTTSNAKGKLGWRRDNWGWTDAWSSWWLEANMTSYNGLLFGTEIMNRYKVAPIVGEPADLGYANANGQPFGDLVRQVQFYHGNSFGNGNLDANAGNATAANNFRAASNAAGYWLVLTGGSMTTTLSSGAVFNTSLSWQNIGVTPTYENWNVVYELRNSSNAVVWSGVSSFNPRLFLPGAASAKTDVFTLPASVPQGNNYSMFVVVRDPNGYRQPMPLAISGRNSDGSYLLRSNITVGTGAPVNQPPVANAGADQNITLPANSVSISGSASSDPDGSISSFLWTKLSGPASYTIAGNTAASTVVSGLTAGVYLIQLKVTDNGGAVAQDTIKIIVNAAPVTPGNIPPVANAGPNQSITAPASTATLNGSASSDADGTIASYSWVTISGPGSVTINNPNTANPSVAGLQTGGYIFELTVKDNLGATSKDQVTVTVLPQALLPNQAPVANAGVNQTITSPASSITLNGSSSFDPDGKITAFSWKQISGPSTSSIAGSATSTATASLLIAGQYVFQLTVTDNSGVANTDQVIVTVNAAAAKVNIPPVANAGSNDTLALPNNSYTLNATRSKDPDGTIQSYQWQQISGPNTVISTTMDNPQVTVSDLRPGTYEFQVRVTDNSGASATATMDLTVEQGLQSTARFIAFPNPAHDITNLRITSPTTGTVKIFVYDINGKQVLVSEVEKTDDVVYKSLNISSLAPGMYTVQIVIGSKKTMVTKFIKN